jgi:pimeloyl-ACP methyl ester carboxylesterase
VAFSVREHALELEGDRTLRVLEAGQGAPVVLIHGALATADDMLLGPMEALSARYRVLAVDRPGHGLSRRDRFEAAPRRQAELIREGLDELEVLRPILVGHSFGGMISLAWAAAWPQDVAGLVLVSAIVRPEIRPFEHMVLAPRATPGAGPLFSEAAQETTDPELLKALRKAMYAPQAVPERWTRSFPEDLVLDSMVANGEDAAALLTPSALIDIPRIAAPAHILYGGEDPGGGPRAGTPSRSTPCCATAACSGCRASVTWRTTSPSKRWRRRWTGWRPAQTRAA